jgi:hypothetical protein
MKLTLTGTHGTGKTTILEECKKILPSQYYFSTNITRRLIELGVPINESGEDNTQRTIMSIHLKNLQRFDFIADRSVLDCFVYTWHLFDHNKVSADVYKEQLALIQDRVFEQYDAIFYLKPEFELHNDGVRSVSEDFHSDIAERFEYVIKQFKIPVYRLTGSVYDRMQQLMGILDSIQK